MPFDTLDDLQLYYEDQGEGQPVLLLHNYFGSLEVWNAQRDALGQRYHVILADLRGHGRSIGSTERLRLIHVAAEVAQLIRVLDIAPAHLVGSSLGAQVTLHLAREYPHLVRTLTAVGPPYLAGPTTRDYMNRVIDQVLPLGKAGVESERREAERAPGALLRNFMLDRDEQPRDQLEAIERAGEIDLPALIVCGDDDPTFPVRLADEVAGRMPNSELVVFPGAGHFPHRTVPGGFNKVLLDFLHRKS